MKNVGLTYLLVVLSALGGIYSCAASQENKEVISPGEFKVSFFQLARGKTTGQPIGIYVALISTERRQRYGNNLGEIFEEINDPQITVMDNETSEELFKYLNYEHFFALQETPLNHFNLDDLKKTDFFTKVINVDINGSIYSICYDNLPPSQKEAFNRIQQAIFVCLSVTKPKASVELQDWRELLPAEWDRGKKK